MFANNMFPIKEKEEFLVRLGVLTSISNIRFLQPVDPVFEVFIKIRMRFGAGIKVYSKKIERLKKSSSFLSVCYSWFTIETLKGLNN